MICIAHAEACHEPAGPSEHLHADEPATAPLLRSLTPAGMLLMSPAATLLLLAVLLAMLVACYLQWASDARDALHLLRRNPPSRPLTEDEDAALATLRALSGRTHDTQVRVLSGAFSGPSGFGNRPFHSAWLGDVAVLLPFDAWQHVAVDNHAEVVLAGDAALVVRLNGFHIVGARHRVAAEEAEHAAAFEGPLQRKRRIVRPIAACAVHGQRLETAAEVAMRRGDGVRWPGIVIALLALAALPALQIDVALWSRLLLGLPLCAVAGTAVWMAWPRQRGPGAPQPVLQLSGRLNKLMLHPHHPPCWLLGSDHRVQLPAEWLASKRFRSGQHLTLDIRQCDGMVLGAGREWSLAEDRVRFSSAGATWSLAWLGLMLCVLLFGGMFVELPAGISRQHTRDALRLMHGVWWPLTAATGLWHLVQAIHRWRRHLRCHARRSAALAARMPPTR